MSEFTQKSRDDLTESSTCNGQEKFLGKYRGTVVNNVDLGGYGRLQVEVPDVLGLGISSWAMPCVPFAGLQMGMHVVPPIGAGVWVEFEQGNPDYPIWTGFWWGSLPEAPVATKMLTPGAPAISAETIAKAGFVVSDVPVPPMRGPGIMLKSGLSTLVVDSVGVMIIAPTIEIQGVTNINNGALSVLI